MARRLGGSHYKVMALRGNSSIVEDCKSVEEAMQAIDYRNGKAIERGDDPKQYCITYVEWFEHQTDDGRFINSGRSECRVTVYPEKEVQR